MSFSRHSPAALPRSRGWNAPCGETATTVMRSALRPPIRIVQASLRPTARRSPGCVLLIDIPPLASCRDGPDDRPDEHTSELQSLMRISYACLWLYKTNE